jgi:RNA polymerase sigma factor (sigma-70 family)
MKRGRQLSKIEAAEGREREPKGLTPLSAGFLEAFRHRKVSLSEEHDRLLSAIAENREMLRRIVRAYGLSKEDAEDVLQDVFVVSLNKLLTIHNFSGFLLTLTSRKCIQLKRKRAGRESLREKFWADPYGAAALQVDLESKIDFDRIWYLLDRLPRTQCNLLRLWLSGSDPEEIASILGLSPLSIRKIRGRGIERLRALLGQGG